VQSPKSRKCPAAFTCCQGDVGLQNGTNCFGAPCFLATTHPPYQCQTVHLSFSRAAWEADEALQSRPQNNALMVRSGEAESSRDAVRAEQQSNPAVSGTLLICHRKQCSWCCFPSKWCSPRDRPSGRNMAWSKVVRDRRALKRAMGAGIRNCMCEPFALVAGLFRAS
jgi:hypothetical protein